MTSQDANNATQQWTDLFKKWTEAWTQPNVFQQAAGNPVQQWGDQLKKLTDSWTSGGVPFQQGWAPWNLFQFVNPQQSQRGSPQMAGPAELSQLLFQQYVSFWTDFWTKNVSATPSPDVFKNAERQWMDHLQTMSKGFVQVMGSEAYAKALGQWIEQTLVAQQKQASTVLPQMDAALRSVNLPSRTQIDHLLSRLIGLEEHLDDVEDEVRKIRKDAAAERRPAVGAAASDTAADRRTAVASDTDKMPASKAAIRRAQSHAG